MRGFREAAQEFYCKNPIGKVLNKFLDNVKNFESNKTVNNLFEL